MVDPTSDDAEFSAEDDDEGGGESTVAMQSPSFDPATPSPVSIPPPPGFGSVPSPMVATSPVAFPPPGAMGTGPAPEPTKAIGMTAQSPAIAPGTFARTKRTAIGIPPPGQGAQRPPNVPLAAPPQHQRPGPPSAPRTPVAPSRNGDDDDGDGPISETAAVELPDLLGLGGSPPTLTVTGKTPEQMFGLDEAHGAAARAAVRPNARSSTLASSGFASDGAAAVKSGAPTRLEKPAAPRPPVDQESTTTAFVEDLGLPFPAKGGFLPKLNDGDADGDDESTRAVPREELFRSQDAQFVVGDDAAGDDATLAVAPGMNEAALQRMGGFPSPTGLSADGSGGHPAPFLGSAHATTQQSAQYPPMGQAPSSWNTPVAPNASHHGMGATSPMASSTSAMPMLPPYGQPQQGYPPGMQGQQMPMGYPGAQWPAQWPPPQQGQMVPVPRQNRRSPLSGQVIALGIVGVVCLAIFVTGVVLFFTTKF